MSKYFLKPKSVEANVKVELEITQQKQILKIQQVLIDQNLLKILI